ncbi:MAG: hypothetical protein ACK5DD_10250 [Cyclobacteriaceae bacterium]|jgi:uncharacterized integral membrane protein
MDAKKRIMATLAGFVVYFLLGFLLYGILLMDFMAANAGTATNVMRTDADMQWWALIAGNVMQAYLLVYIFGNWANITTFGGGVKAGAIIGFIMSLGFGLNMYGTTNISNLTATLVDPIVMSVMMSLTGGAIGWVLGRK